MKLQEYYLLFRLHYHAYEAGPIQTGIEEISKVLHCTTKHTKRLLQRYEEEEWLAWERGKGRGKKSTFTFKEDLLFWAKEYMAHLQKEQQLQTMMDVLRMNFPPHYRSSLLEFVLPHLGLQQSTDTYDILRIMQQRKFSTLDPAKVSITAESHLVSQLFDTLVQYDKETDSIIPHIAHHWEWSTDENSWTFYLRKGILFHHGKELTSRDVAFTLERLQESEVTRWAFKQVRSITCLTPYTLRISLHSSIPWFLFFLATSNTAILPKDQSFDEKKLIGSGAFRVKQYTDSLLTLEAHRDYFLERPLIDRVDIHFLQGKSLKPDRILTINQEESGQLEQYDKVERGSMYGIFQVKKDSMMEDIHLRKALSHCLDGERLLDSFPGTSRTYPSTSFLPIHSKHYYEPKSLVIGKEALTASSYSGETCLVYHLDFQRSTEDAQWFATRCAQIGIIIELRSYSLSCAYAEDFASDGDMILMGEVFSDNEFLSFVQLFYNEASFVCRYLNAEQLALLLPMVTEYMETKGIENRRLVQRQIEKYMLDHYWIAFYYHVRKKASYDDSIAGVQFNSFSWPDFRKIWVKRS